MIYIFNRHEKMINSLDIEPKVTREIGKLNVLEFDSVHEFEKGYRVVYFIDNKPYEFIIDDIDYERIDDTVFSYYCKDSLFELEGSFIQEKRPTGSYNDHLTEVLRDERWELVIKPDFAQTVTKFLSYYQISVFEAIGKVIEEFNIEFYTEFEGNTKITKRKLVIGKIGRESNQILEFGKNITKFNRSIKPGLVITALKAYGKGEETEGGGYGRRLTFADINNGKDYVENIQARDNFGIGELGSKKHVFGKIIYEEVEDKQELLDLARKDLMTLSQVNAEYQVDAIDIDGTMYYGDVIGMIDEEIGFRGYTRIIKEVRFGDFTEFTFGNIQKTFTESISGQIKQETEAVKNEVTSILQSKLDKINNIYLNEDGYTYNLDVGNEYALPAGIYSFDRPIDDNPTKVIYIGAGKMLISNEKGTDGAWIWQTFATGDGLIGDAIVTNSITANKLAADVGQELDISSNVAITSKVSKTEILTDPEIREALKGEDGEKGQSISAVTEQWYNSTSNEELTGGQWWDDNIPGWGIGTFYWKRLKITYANPSNTEYTEPILDTVNTALGDVYNSGIILPSQKTAFLIKLSEMTEEHTILELSDGLPEYTAYNLAYNDLRALLDGITANMESSSDIRIGEFKTLNDTYEAAHNALRQAVNRLSTDSLIDLESRVTSAEQKITDESIVNTVTSSSEYIQGVLDKLTTLEQTDESFQASISQNLKKIGEIESSKIMSYFNFQMDAQGNGYTELGSNLDGMKLRQYRDRISFVNGELEQAYFANKAMVVDEVRTKLLAIGENYEIKEINETTIEGWYHGG